MSRKFEEAVRLGIGILIAAAAAGLLVLFLHGRALAEDGPMEADFQALLPAPPPSLAERLESLETRIEEERHERFQEAVRVVLAAAWRAGTRQSLSGAISGARGVWRAVRILRAPLRSEREALTFVEAELRAGEQDAHLDAMYSELFDRVGERRLERRIDRTSDALRLGDVSRARLRLEQLRQQAPGHPKVASLAEALDELERRREEERATLLELHEQPTSREAALLQALLLGDVQTVCRGELDEDRSLACAAGLYHAGDRERALELLSRTAEAGGGAGIVAARWLDDDEVHPEGGWDGVELRDGVRQALGWIGGADLEERGLELSSRGLRAWRSAASPLNLAMSLPARMVSRRAPSRGGIRVRAISYLDRHPNGPAAEKARAWLARTEPSEAEQRRRDLFTDGILSLPRARTPYASVVARPFLITRALLEEGGEAFHTLVELVGDADGVLLFAIDRRIPIEGQPLAPRQAAAVLDAMVDLIDHERARPIPGSRPAALGALRRLSSRVDSDRVLVARPWTEDSGEAPDSGLLAMMETRTARLAGVDVAGGGDELRAHRDLFDAGLICPERVVCLDRERVLGGQMYGRLEVDGEATLGLHTRVPGASLTVEIGEAGPRAMLDLPVTSLLGLDRWLPVRASVAVDLGGIQVAPRLDSRSVASSR